MQLTNLLAACVLIAPAFASELKIKIKTHTHKTVDPATEGLVLYNGNWGYWITQYAGGSRSVFRTATKKCSKYTTGPHTVTVTKDVSSTQLYTKPGTTLYSSASQYPKPPAYGHSHTISKSEYKPSSRHTVDSTVTQDTTKYYTVPSRSNPTPPSYSHSSWAYVPVYPESSSSPSTKCTKSKSTSHSVSSPPVYVSTTQAPSTKVTIIYITKPCTACSQSTTVKTKTLSATSCVTKPVSYITKTYSTMMTVKPSTATPYAKTVTSCKTFTAPPTTYWVWPTKYSSYMMPPVYATSVGTKCRSHPKPCKHARDLVEYTETAILCSTSSMSSSVTHPPTYSSEPMTTEPVTVSSSTSCSTTPTPTPYVSTVTSCVTYSSGTSTWTSNVVTSSVVTPVQPPPTWTSTPSVYMPKPTTNGTYTPSMSPVMPVNDASFAKAEHVRAYALALVGGMSLYYL